MNPLQKVYCRLYQTGFRLAIPFLPYRSPEIMESIEQIPSLLHQKGIHSVLLVTDQFLRNSGATACLETILTESGIHCCIFDQTQANPTVKNVESARLMYLYGECEALIAFGGGSSIDCAKAVGARIAYPNKTLRQLKGLLRVLRRLPPLIAIPTTAGTGSEVTVTAVITDSENKHKYTMNNFTMIPHYAVLDPTVTYSLPPHLTATTGMDALTHAVEAYIGNSTTKQTRQLALDAVRLIFENIEAAYQNGQDHVARANMLQAAHKAGIAFSKSYVGYIHSIAHSLGGQYNIPHGLANSVLMPYVLEFYGQSAERKLAELAVAAGVIEAGDTHADGARKFIEAIRSMNKRMGIPETLSGIQKADIPKMAEHASAEANPLYPVPKLMNAKELEQLYIQVSSRSEKYANSGNTERAAGLLPQRRDLTRQLPHQPA